MKCPNCGTNNKDGMKFCKMCGNELPDNYFDTKESNIQKPKGKSPKWLIIAIIIVAVAIIGIVAFLLFSSLIEKNDNDLDADHYSKAAVETTIENDMSSQVTTQGTSEQSTQLATTGTALKVPNVEGMKSNDAYEKISDLGLKYKAEFDYSDTVPEDYVISQSPEEEKAINIGDTVTLKISRGTKSSDVSNSSSSSNTPISSNVSSGSNTADRYGLNVSSRYISRNDISWMSLDEIQMAINEVYAKLGFRFTKAPYSTYFNSMDWYHPDTEDMNVIEKRMNKYEYENMKVMGSYRDSLSN